MRYERQHLYRRITDRNRRVEDVASSRGAGFVCCVNDCDHLTGCNGRVRLDEDVEADGWIHDVVHGPPATAERDHAVTNRARLDTRPVSATTGGATRHPSRADRRPAPL